MKFKEILSLLILFVLSINGCTENIFEPQEKEKLNDIKSPPIEPFYPIPSKSQLKWQDSELLMFIHFGINTFTGKEWGDGTEDPSLFNPKNVDAEQWVKVAKEAGFKYLIFTAKHHDGFCLWPSKYTGYTIKNSPYKNGQGDIVKEVSEACQKYNMNFGLYLSPWDRHEPSYGTNDYDIFYQNQLIELLTNYGKISEVWLDGANGEEIDGKVINYNWDLYYSTIRHYQPDALIANMGPDVRWIGNENGLAEETEWCIQPKSLTMQQTFGWDNNNVWFPSECDVSIRPGWFYHSSEDQQVKSADALKDIYLKSVGRNSNLLLNIPPNKDGLISNYDIAVLKQWRNSINSIFSEDIFYLKKIESSNTRNKLDNYSEKNCLDNYRETFWVTDKNVLSAELIINLEKKEKINMIRVEEAIEYGQRIKSYSLHFDNNGQWESFMRDQQ